MANYMTVAEYNVIQNAIDEGEVEVTFSKSSTLGTNDVYIGGEYFTTISEEDYELLEV